MFMHIFSDMILDQQVGSGQLNEDVRHRVHEALLKQHHHQNQKKLSNRIPIVRSFADIGKKQSEPHSMDKNGNALFYFAFWAFSNTCLFSITCTFYPVWFCSEKLLCKSGAFYMRVVSFRHSVTDVFKCEIQVSCTIEGCTKILKGTSSGVGSRVAVLVWHSVLGNWHGTLSVVQHSSSTLVVL